MPYPAVKGAPRPGRDICETAMTRESPPLETRAQAKPRPGKAGTGIPPRAATYA